MSDNKNKKKKNREQKIKHDRLYKKLNSGVSKGDLKNGKVKFYIMGVIVIIAIAFVFYSMN